MTADEREFLKMIRPGLHIIRAVLLSSLKQERTRYGHARTPFRSGIRQGLLRSERIVNNLTNATQFFRMLKARADKRERERQ